MGPKKKNKNGIPDRWTDYQALGKRIPGTRFVAFKVPLKQSLRSLLPPSMAFGPLDLIRQLEERQEELGLIIDLTYTTRYYTLEDLPNSVLYLKIYTAGHAVPSNPTILSFKQAVRAFLRENESNDKLIGVHCTHGLNRTGYLVCRYLIDVEGMEPAQAIKLFNKSRGHCIERGNYLQDLQHGPKRSNTDMDKTDQQPVWGKADPLPRLPPHSEREAFGDGPYYDPYMSLYQWGGQNQRHRYSYGPPVPPPAFGIQPPSTFCSNQHRGAPRGRRAPPSPRVAAFPVQQYVWPGSSYWIPGESADGHPEGPHDERWRAPRKKYLRRRRKDRP
ncbi:RNA/RNP complex-1-interacting phosphatase [Arapaima gigas]